MKTSDPQSVLVRIVLSFALIGTLLFCVFGFLATFEPNPPVKQWLWRGLYGGVVLGCIVGLLKGMRR